MSKLVLNAIAREIVRERRPARDFRAGLDKPNPVCYAVSRPEKPGQKEEK